MIAYGDAFETLNDLLDEYGSQGASEWLLKEHPVHELREYNPGVPGQMDDELPGAMVLGDKRGPFALNLHGIESAFTADMWVSRTWNRWMGTIQWNNAGEIISDTPRSETERALMRQSFEEAAQELNLTTSQLQAVLWYYEQGLYRAMGVTKESGSFAAAARRVADEAAATSSASARARSPARTSAALSRQQ